LFICGGNIARSYEFKLPIVRTAQVENLYLWGKHWRYSFSLFVRGCAH